MGTSALNMLFKVRLTIFHNHPQDLNLGSLQLVSQAAFSLTLPQAFHSSVADQILLVELKIVHQDESSLQGPKLVSGRLIYHFWPI